MRPLPRPPALHHVASGVVLAVCAVCAATLAILAGTVLEGVPAACYAWITLYGLLVRYGVLNGRRTETDVAVGPSS